ncbi:tetratricopeptide repeat-containing diguanylate cyclase [Pseudocolwellia agarivorans]|uniref:tetratricopeptide repeat-containing diguanylate cyclase n=1 Tax=Pseudocolwellia agarivorans TaxID=1911682 RepID=UPI00098682BF|nr:tetratricopeptide repeat-containing diguanylate cyclase [Pseudocolwellia agarivorans]
MKLIRLSAFRIFVLLFIFGLPTFAQAQIQTQMEIDKRIDSLTHDTTLTPKEILAELDPLIDVIKKNQWPVILIKAMSLKVQQLSILEHFNEANDLINEFLPKAKKLNLKNEILNFELGSLVIEDAKGFSKKVIEMREILLNKAEAETDKSIVALIYVDLGGSEILSRNYTLALQYFKKAYQLYLSLDDKVNTSLVFTEIAGVYLSLEDYERAKEFYREALNIFKETKKQFSESIVLHNLGRTYLFNGEYKEAKEIFEESLALSTLLDDKIGVTWAQFSLASVLFHEKKWQEALNYYKGTAEIFAESGDKHMYFESLLGVMKTQIKLKNTDEAADVLKQLEILLADINQPTYSAFFLEVSAQLAYAQGDYLTAYQNEKKYREQKELIHKIETKQNSHKYRVQFESELKENENKMLLKENELKNLKIAQQQQQKKYGYLIIAFTIGVIFIFAFMLFKLNQHRNRFKEMALKDHLTNSPNRRAILQYANERFKEAKCNHVDLSIGIIDLDFFKKVNDTYGHDVGDEVLKSFAIACRTIMRKEDKFGRYGGEEWLFVLPDTNKNNIKLIFERLHQELNNRPIIGLPPEQYITFSMGVAGFKHGEDTSLHALIMRADDCLYKAKGAGRNKLEIEHV